MVEPVWVPCGRRVVVGGDGGSEVVPCCGDARSDGQWQRQEHEGVETVGAGALVRQDWVPFVDVFEGQVVVAIVLDRVDDVHVKDSS